MRRIKFVVFYSAVLFLLSAIGIAQTQKISCDQIRSDAGKLFDSSRTKSRVDDRLALLKPIDTALRGLDSCREEDFLSRNIVLLNMDAQLESYLWAFMYDQAADLAKHTVETVCQ